MLPDHHACLCRYRRLVVDCEDNRQIAPWKPTFEFTSEPTRQEVILEVTRRLEPLQEKMDRLTAAFNVRRQADVK